MRNVVCTSCLVSLNNSFNHAMMNGQILCASCYKDLLLKTIPLGAQTEKVKTTQIETKGYNEPDHYHQNEIDTIAFLQGGFPPNVFIGFALGSAIKYLHRYEKKNGYEDLDKAMDYIKRLKDFLQEKDLL